MHWIWILKKYFYLKINRKYLRKFIIQIYFSINIKYKYCIFMFMNFYFCWDIVFFFYFQVFLVFSWKDITLDFLKTLLFILVCGLPVSKCSLQTGAKTSPILIEMVFLGWAPALRKLKKIPDFPITRSNNSFPKFCKAAKIKNTSEIHYLYYMPYNIYLYHTDRGKKTNKNRKRHSRKNKIKTKKTFSVNDLLISRHCSLLPPSDVFWGNKGDIDLAWVNILECQCISSKKDTKDAWRWCCCNDVMIFDIERDTSFQVMQIKSYIMNFIFSKEW